MLNREQVLKLGFKELPHPTIGNSLIFDLGRNRNLSLSSLGTPNEVLYICERDEIDIKKINDLVCLWNYDYDGYLSLEKLSLILSFFAENKIIMKEYLVCYEDKMQGANFSDRLTLEEVNEFIKSNDIVEHSFGYYVVKIVEDEFRKKT